MIAAFLWILCFAAHSHAFTISNGQFTENFSDPTYFDAANSTGLWNAIDGAAEGGRFANVGGSFKTISFGDGSDGAVNTSSGYTFDTNSHPNGYNFTQLSITGGTITVTGSNPL